MASCGSNKLPTKLNGQINPCHKPNQNPDDLASTHWLTSTAFMQELIKKILQNEPIDGLFCTDDLTAILAYEAAQEVGIKIPQDLDLIGYDGTNLIRNYFPQLSTIQQPIEEISSLLIELLLKQINGYTPKRNETFKLPVKLIVGD